MQRKKNASLAGYSDGVSCEATKYCYFRYLLSVNVYRDYINYELTVKMSSCTLEVILTLKEW